MPAATPSKLYSPLESVVAVATTAGVDALSYSLTVTPDAEAPFARLTVPVITDPVVNRTVSVSVMAVPPKVPETTVEGSEPDDFKVAV